ncbi:MAG: WD40 repeat domain-containing protein [Thermoguttaceae bacterium]
MFALTFLSYLLVSVAVLQADVTATEFDVSNESGPNAESLTESIIDGNVSDEKVTSENKSDEDDEVIDTIKPRGEKASGKKASAENVNIEDYFYSEGDFPHAESIRDDSMLAELQAIENFKIRKANEAKFAGKLFWGNVSGIDGENPDLTYNVAGVSSAANKGADIITLQGHNNSVNVVSYLPDQIHLISGSSDRQIILWDTINGSITKKYNGNRSPVITLAVNPDGKSFFAGSLDKRVRCWDIRSEVPNTTYPASEYEPTAICVNPNSQILLVGTRDGNINEIHLNESADSTRTMKAHAMAINVIRYNSRGTAFITAGNDKSVIMWNAENMSRARTFQGHKAAVLCASFSPNDDLVVSGGLDNTVIVWDANSGIETLRLTGHLNAITAVAFTADGSKIMSASRDRTVVFWDAKTGAKLATCEKRNSPILSASLNKINENVAISMQNGTIEILTSNAFNKQGNSSLAADSGLPTTPDNTDAQTPTVKSQTPDSGDNSIDVANDEFSSLPQAVRKFRYGRISSFDDIGCVSPDGNAFVAITSEKSEGNVWQTDNGKLIRLFTSRIPVSAVAFMPQDSDTIIAGTRSGMLQLIGVSEMNVIYSFDIHSAAIKSINCSQDGSTAISVATDGVVSILDLKGKKLSGTISDDKFKITSAAISPGAEVIVTGSDDAAINIWDAATRTHRYKIEEHSGVITNIIFHPNGTQFITAAEDGRIILWDLNSRRIIREYKGQKGGVASIAITPNGAFLIVGGKKEERSIIYNTQTGEPLMILPNQGGPVNAVFFHPRQFSVITIGGRSPSYWDISGLSKQ